MRYCKDCEDYNICRGTHKINAYSWECADFMEVKKCPHCGKKLVKYFHGGFPNDPFLRCDNGDCSHAWEVYSISGLGIKND